MGVMWTEEQKKVIEERGRNILVSAAAGSGKTAVLVERIIQKITDEKNPVDIDRLLVVTFTHAAAAEMKERIGAALDKRMLEEPDNLLLERQSSLLRSAQITTIHSFCLYVIRNHFNEIDLDPSFRIADEMELTLMRADTMEAVLETKYEEGAEDFLNFVECYAKGKTDESIETLISQLYTYSRSYPWPKSWLSQCLSMLDIKDEADFYKMPLIQSLMADIHHILKDLRERLLLALKLCRLPDGPLFYDEAIDDDLNFIDRLLACETIDAYRRTSEDFKWRALSRKKMPEASDEKKQLVKGLRDSVKASVEKLRKDYFYTDTAAMIEDIRRTVPPMRVLLSLVSEFSDEYQKRKAAKNVLDFGDLEHFALDILLKRDDEGCIFASAAAKALAERFEEVLCDEYQDSNLVQETLLRAVSKEDMGGHNRFMVGDVKQSIYKFRLARPELFMEKYKTYPTEGSPEALRIDLHKNFRSRDCVVDFVNLVFEHIMGEALGGIIYDEKAALHRGAKFVPYDGEGFVSDGTEVILVDTAKTDESGANGAAKDRLGEDENSDDSLSLLAGREMTAKEWEAKSVADRIHRLMDEGMCVLDKETGAYRPLMYKDIVILLRTMSGYSESFASVLEREHIPVHTEVSTGFFDTLEIRTLIAFLSIIDNPLQDIALAAVMKSCLFEFTDEALAMIRAVSKQTSFYDACKSFMNKENDALLETHFDMAACEAVRKKLKQFMDMLARFRQYVFYMPIHKLILKIYEETGCYYLMSAMPLGVKRRANLDMLVAKAVDYEKTSYKGLFNFVRYIRRLEKYEADMGEASVLGENEDAVRIMSIHKSKGLEYPVVFVSAMSKRFNQQDARSSLLIHSEFGLGPEAVDDRARIKCPTILKNALAGRIVSENLGEELRVLYVALTRAKEKLILTGVCEDTKKAFEKWEETAMASGSMLAYTDLISAASYFDWVMPVLLKEEYRQASSADVTIVQTNISSLMSQTVQKAVESRVLKAGLLGLSDEELTERASEIFDAHMSWEYPHKNAVHMHPKMTVSELKAMEEGYEEMTADDSFVRRIELYAAEDEKLLDEVQVLPAGQQTEDMQPDVKARIEAAAKRGTAVHKLMELADFEHIHSLDDVKAYIRRLCADGVTDAWAAENINPWLIFNFCRSPLGRRMAAAAGAGVLYREKQFMIGVDAGKIFHTDSKEMILVQGVIDACFEEDGKLIIVDYKTDCVKDEAVLIQRYEKQLEYYEMAASRLMGLPVSEKYIYAFSMDRAIRVM